MIAAFPVTWPAGAALRQRSAKAMEIILHIGAHRCASTSFQHYMRCNAERLGRERTGFWGPWRTRAGLFRGVIPTPGPARGDPARRAAGRIALGLARSAANGVERLVVSDENMIGSLRENLRQGVLYGGVGERMARFAQAFGHRVSTVALTVRSPEWYWASALGHAVARGRGVPGPRALARLGQGARSWRDVVTDVACAMPEARLIVLPFSGSRAGPRLSLRC